MTIRSLFNSLHHIRSSPFLGVEQPVPDDLELKRVHEIILRETGGNAGIALRETDTFKSLLESGFKKVFRRHNPDSPGTGIYRTVGIHVSVKFPCPAGKPLSVGWHIFTVVFPLEKTPQVLVAGNNRPPFPLSFYQMLYCLAIRFIVRNKSVFVL